MAAQLKAKDRPDLAEFSWDDAFLLKARTSG